MVLVRDSERFQSIPSCCMRMPSTCEDSVTVATTVVAKTSVLSFRVASVSSSVLSWVLCHLGQYGIKRGA